MLQKLVGFVTKCVVSGRFWPLVRCTLAKQATVWEANFGTLASVANRWPIGLAHQHSGFSFAFPGQNAPPIAVWGGRTAENSRVLHRHSNWHSCPHRHNSAPLSSCAPVHALIGNVCTGASAHRVRFVFRFVAWPGMSRFTSQPSVPRPLEKDNYLPIA